MQITFSTSLFNRGDAVAASMWIITLMCILISFAKDRGKTKLAIRSSLGMFFGLFPSISLMILLVGFLLAAIPLEVIGQLFSKNGLTGFVLVSAVGSIASIPGPIAFPLAGELYHAGAYLPSLASFITTLTMVGVVTAPIEISFFGKKFTLLRQFLSFISALCIGLLVGALL
ncbi:hypothetical protein RF679_16585 [Undibacterium cyanobacteriorum]|uniref:Permease n=1 Tax=Undibacterium cyanobacteriorum TaxID=3073561 RepID=A0ABY9RHD3_9BURK|nr:hypothetical protein [Undibacterium sp. 20NA77.5]WMW80248.1 hypothetical protein RF679_16585 [Undibacterium sp. 20NA77.5]